MEIFLTGYATVPDYKIGSIVQVTADGQTVFINEEYEFLTNTATPNSGSLQIHTQVDAAGNPNFVNDRYWFSEDFSGAGNPISVHLNRKPRNYGYICGG